MKRGVFILALVAALGVTVLFWPGTTSTDRTEIVVSSGDTAHAISRRLVEEGALRSRVPFLIWTRLKGADSKLKSGLYYFRKNRSAYWIVDDLIKGRTEKVKLIIPEGFASWQIADRLDALRITSGEEFKRIVAQRDLEGFLFPATYSLNLGISADEVARELRAQFDKNWSPEFDRRAAELGWNQKQTVTMASIVEREVRVRDELPMVSAVYHNRLKKRMRLEADPTVQFAMGHWKSRLTYADYKNTKSPYNTYLNFGLPPGPIANPGLDAIRAALWPAMTDALFFVALDDGRHSFSATYRQHVNKVNARNREKRRKNG
jgi:UPF0755 protein